jgi:hypothetical protein
MFAFAALFLTAVAFALLTYAADRMRNYTIAALLAGGAWLFGVSSVLIAY